MSEHKLGPAAQCVSVCLHIWSIPGGQTNVTLKRNSHYFRLICKNWPLTLITASHCGRLGPGLFLYLVFKSVQCSVCDAAAQVLFHHYPWFIDTMTPDSGDTLGDETIHCRTRAIVVTMSLTTPQHCPMSPAWPHVMPLIQQPDTFKNPFNSDRTIFSWLKFIICKLMLNWCWKHPCIAGC